MLAFTTLEAELESRWPENRLEPTLDRIVALLDSVGNPHRVVPTIHITGTNGKSTTARMIDELLRAHGLRTGRYTSPHLESVRERIVVEGDSVDPHLFVEIHGELAPHIRTMDASGSVPLSFFEIMTAIGLTAFARVGVDVAIVEVGMGGTWDATNVIDGRVCVITPISLDHVDYLGPDEVAIAAEKSGIVKFGSTLVTGPQLKAVTDVLTARADDMRAAVVHVDRIVRIVERLQHPDRQLLHLATAEQDYPDIELAIAGRHQAENACTAVAAVEAFLAGDGDALEPRRVRQAFARVTAPGRLEPVGANPTTVIDVSHNPAGMTVTAAAFEEAYPDGRTVVVLAVLGDKDIDGILRALMPLAWRIVLTENESPRRLPAHRLADRARAIVPGEMLHEEPDYGAAVDYARALAREAGAGANVLVTGSVVTAGQARALLT